MPNSLSITQGIECGLKNKKTNLKETKSVCPHLNRAEAE